HIAVLDINEQAGKALENELNAKLGAKRVKFLPCDVSNDDQLLSCFKAVVDDQGYLDVVINNAAIMNDSLRTYRKEILLNLTALVTSTLESMAIMGKDKGGKGGTVINISSVASLCQSPIFPIYFGTKSAVTQFSNCIGMNEYYSKTGVRVVSVCFGATETPLLNNCTLEHFNNDVITESAAQGVVDAFKLAESGSTWLSTSNRPVRDITATVQKAYGILSELVFQ
ncbi:putative alcohol dehydrogenase, partial [Operophtera brumata]